MKNLHILLFTFAVLLMSSCEVIDNLKPASKDDKEDETTQPQPTNPTNTNPTDTTSAPIVETVAQDLVNQSYGNDDLQKYDMHLPAKRSQTATKVVIILHGGSWKELDKGFMNNYVNQIKSKGDNWVIVNANYRLTFQNGIKYDQQIEDINTIVNKVLSLRKQHNYSDKIYLLGASAGGHLALAYAYTVDKLKYIKGVSVIAAPIDLTSDKIRVGQFGQDIEKMVGKPYGEAPDEYKRVSPRYQVSKSVPPTILFYGGNDSFIPADQGEFLVQQLQANGISRSYNFYPEQTHEWMLLNETIDKTLAFFGDDPADNTRN